VVFSVVVRSGIGRDGQQSDSALLSTFGLGVVVNIRIGHGGKQSDKTWW
jgi:hypothetical protein